jgi:Tol biopolymer transport system component
MRRRAGAVLIAVLVTLAGCTPNPTPARDPGRVLLPVTHVKVPGRLYATKGRILHRFAGTTSRSLLDDARVKDPAVTLDGDRLAFAQLQAQSATVMISDAAGSNRRPITAASAPEGALWAVMPAFSSDGQRIAYISDREKRPSSPRNLQPNDFGVWVFDAPAARSRRVTTPVAYTGGDSDPVFRPGVNDQLIYTTYRYSGAPLQPVARLMWRSLATGLAVSLSPDLARNFQPAFSPDGHFLAFIQAGASGDDLYVLPLDPGFTRQPASSPTASAILLQTGMVAQPVWAPDGKAIAYLKLVNGSFDLYVLPISTVGTVRAIGEAWAITRGSFLDADSRLAWSR